MDPALAKGLVHARRSRKMRFALAAHLQARTINDQRDYPPVHTIDLPPDRHGRVASGQRGMMRAEQR
jgi:hypothetical protein